MQFDMSFATTVSTRLHMWPIMCKYDVFSINRKYIHNIETPSEEDKATVMDDMHKIW